MEEARKRKINANRIQHLWSAASDHAVALSTKARQEEEEKLRASGHNLVATISKKEAADKKQEFRAAFEVFDKVGRGPPVGPELLSTALDTAFGSGRQWLYQPR